MDVFVSRDGQPLPGLSADAFELFDNGFVQENVTLVEAERLPLAAILLLDTSESVRGSKLQNLRRAARAFMDELDDTDSVAVVTFSTRYRILHSFTHDHAAAKRALDSVNGSGATALFESLFFTLVHAEEGQGRPLIVLFSDGLDTASWLPAKEVLESARRSNAVLFAVHAASKAGIHLGTTESDSGAFIETYPDLVGGQALASIVQATAGRVLSIRSTDSLPSAFRRILYEMRGRYILAYEPRDTSEGWHEIEVRLKGLTSTELRARVGYYSR